MRRPLLLAAMVQLMLLGGPAAAHAEGWLDRYNRAVFAANAALARAANEIVEAAPEGIGIPQSWRDAGANLLLNTINEPLTALSHAVAGQADAAVTSVQRFGTNILLGYGGLRDRASELGLIVPPLDFGLALCSHGVAEGPYFIVPLVGPRTLRDGLADFVVTNGIIYAALLPLVGGAPGIGAVLLVLALDELATVAMVRQIDAPELSGDLTFEAQRDLYLAQRRARCAAVGQPLP
jgi:phospholipid-binding lipoprotein MlaA